MPENAQNQTYEDLVNEFMRDSIDSISFNEKAGAFHVFPRERFQIAYGSRTLRT